MNEPAPLAAAWECRVCWYCYQPEEGDDVAQIPAGTRFEDLPANWCCPGCDAAKADFLQVSD